MKEIIYAIIIILFSSLISGVRASGPQTDGTPLLFIGTVVQLAPAPKTTSGRRAVYQLVKYRIERVCQGSYEGTEIVVDHLIICLDQLKGLKVGDRVCVLVEKSSKIHARYNYQGIRSPSDVVCIFYIGSGVSFTKEEGCSCGEDVFKSPCQDKNKQR